MTGQPTSRYACESCGATPEQAVIHRTSPKGEAFRGKCAVCLAYQRGRRQAAEEIAQVIGDMAAEGDIDTNPHSSAYVTAAEVARTIGRSA